MGVSLCLGSRWFLFGLGLRGGMSSLCHDDLDHGVIVRVGFVPDIRSLVMIFRGGVRGVGDDVHRDQGTY